MHAKSLVFVAMVSCAAAARGDIIVNFVENTVTNSITVTATGSLQTAQFGTPATGNYVFGSNLLPITGSVFLGPIPSMADHFTFATPFVLPYGTGNLGSGTFIGPDVFLIEANGSNPDQLRLPANYVSGTNITAASVFSGSFASRGINTSTVVMTLPGSQTITLAFQSIPTPGAAALLGLGGLAMTRRRR